MVGTVCFVTHEEDARLEQLGRRHWREMGSLIHYSLRMESNLSEFNVPLLPVSTKKVSIYCEVSSSKIDWEQITPVVLWNEKRSKKYIWVTFGFLYEMGPWYTSSQRSKWKWRNSGMSQNGEARISPDNGFSETNILDSVIQYRSRSIENWWCFAKSPSHKLCQNFYETVLFKVWRRPSDSPRGVLSNGLHIVEVEILFTC